jgi:hypothetical protein
MDALRNLARSDLPDRVNKKNIDLYLEEGAGPQPAEPPRRSALIYLSIVDSE